MQMALGTWSRGGKGEHGSGAEGDWQGLGEEPLLKELIPPGGLTRPGWPRLGQGSSQQRDNHPVASRGTLAPEDPHPVPHNAQGSLQAVACSSETSVRS